MTAGAIRHASPSLPRRQPSIGRNARPSLGRLADLILCFLCFYGRLGTMNDHELIRTGEAATILGSSRQHVVDLCNQGVLTCERSPTQRRLRRSEVEAFASRTESGPRLNRDQRQSLWLHGAVAGHLATNPIGTLERARTNLARLRTTHPTGMSSRWLDSWQSVLDQGPEAILETLTSPSALAIELRQNSPFAGVLPSEERSGVLSALRTMERSTSS
jgi:excisionase family DNA binding protein